MGRPAKFDRDQAVQTAMDEIWRHGFEACSVKAISERLGITRSSFYNTFKSREALFTEALNLYFTQAPDRALSDVRPGAPVLPLISATFREICRVRAEDPEARGCMAVNCVTELVGVDPSLGPVLERAIRRSRARFHDLLRQAKAQGEIDGAVDLEVTASALQSLLIGLNVMSKVERSEESLWAMTERTLLGLGLLPER